MIATPSSVRHMPNARMEFPFNNLCAHLSDDQLKVTTLRFHPKIPNQSAILADSGACRPPLRGWVVARPSPYSATIWLKAVLPHPGMLPSGPGIASPECSRGRITLSIGSCATRFPVRSASLLSHPDLALPEPRRAAEGKGGAEPPGATRSAPYSASMARVGPRSGPTATGPSPE